nr:hypothetical protein [Tanacetum cinerariifolium]
AQLFKNTSESMNNTSGTSVTPQVDKPKLIAVTPYPKKLHASFLVDMVPNNQSSASIRINPITNSQRHVTFKENVSSDMVNSSSTRLVHTARTKRPQPKGNTRNDRVPSASMSSEAKKNVIVEDHCTSVTPQVDKPKLIAVTPYPKKLHASFLSRSVPQLREINVVKHSNVISPGMFKIDPS